VYAHVDGFLGTYLLAVPAEDATELVDLVDERIAVPLLVLAGDELDAISRADLGAETAGDALRAPLLVGEHPVGAPPARRQAPRPHPVRPVGALLLRVLHRDPLLEHVLESERHPFERGP